MELVVKDTVKFLDAISINETVFESAVRGSKEGFVLILIYLAIAVPSLFVLPIFVIWTIAYLIYVFVIRRHAKTKPLSERSLHTALDILGEAVAELVFTPVVLMALCDNPKGPMDKVKEDFITDNMKEWGYEENYIARFLKEKISLGYDKQMLQVVDWKLILQDKQRREKGQGKVSLKDFDHKDLRRKSIALCDELYRRQGETGTVYENCLAQLKYRMKV